MVQPFVVEGLSFNSHLERVMYNYKPRLTVSHWLPVITFCPVNNLPDVIYVYVTFDSFAELYAVRKQVRKLVSFKKMFMEDVAMTVLTSIEGAVEVEVRLITSRHVVKVNKLQNKE